MSGTVTAAVEGAVDAVPAGPAAGGAGDMGAGDCLLVWDSEPGTIIIIIIVCWYLVLGRVPCKAQA
jgi:hypothetical protein